MSKEIIATHLNHFGDRLDRLSQKRVTSEEIMVTHGIASSIVVAIIFHLSHLTKEYVQISDLLHDAEQYKEAIIAIQEASKYSRLMNNLGAAYFSAFLALFLETIIRRNNSLVFKSENISNNPAYPDDEISERGIPLSTHLLPGIARLSKKLSSNFQGA